jgi:hypothetical protein
MGSAHIPSDARSNPFMRPGKPHFEDPRAANTSAGQACCLEFAPAGLESGKSPKLNYEAASMNKRRKCPGIVVLRHERETSPSMEASSRIVTEPSLTVEGNALLHT